MFNSVSLCFFNLKKNNGMWSLWKGLCLWKIGPHTLNKASLVSQFLPMSVCKGKIHISWKCSVSFFPLFYHNRSTALVCVGRHMCFTVLRWFCRFWFAADGGCDLCWSWHLTEVLVGVLKQGSKTFYHPVVLSRSHLRQNLLLAVVHAVVVISGVSAADFIYFQQNCTVSLSNKNSSCCSFIFKRL